MQTEKNMRVPRTFFFAVSAAVGLLLSGGPAGAQETDAGPPPSGPVFSLPPGQNNEPEPDVVGPRAPGMAPPRLITNDEQTPQTTDNATPPSPRPDANADTSSAPVSTANNRPRNPVPASVAADTSSGNPAPVRDQEVAAIVAGADGSEETPALDADSALLQPPAVASASPVSEPDIAPSSQTWLLPAAALLLLLLIGLFLWKRRSGAMQTAGTRAVEEPVVPQPELAPTGPPAGPLAPRSNVVPQSPPPAPPVPAPSAAGLSVSRPSSTTVSPLTAPLVARSQDRLSAPPPRFTPSVPPPVPRPSTTDRPGQVEIEFQPREAELTTEAFVIAFHLLLHNVSSEPVRDIAISMGIRAADRSPGQPGNTRATTQIKAESLAGHATGKFEGKVRLARSEFKRFQVEGKPVLIPIIDLIPRYVDCDDGLREASISLILGREQNPPTDRVLPIRLDRPEARLGAIGCRIIESASGDANSQN